MSGPLEKILTHLTAASRSLTHSDASLHEARRLLASSAEASELAGVEDAIADLLSAIAGVFGSVAIAARLGAAVDLEDQEARATAALPPSDARRPLPPDVLAAALPDIPPTPSRFLCSTPIDPARTEAALPPSDIAAAIAPVKVAS